jgi:hypothetical protein
MKGRERGRERGDSGSGTRCQAPSVKRLIIEFDALSLSLYLYHYHLPSVYDGYHIRTRESI